MNPIENIWAGLKHHLRKYVKLTNKDELIDGIKAYWRGVSKETCQRYIGHVQKVIPAVIACDGGPSGY